MPDLTSDLVPDLTPSDVVARYGGLASRAQLDRHCTPRAITRAVRSGSLVRARRGIYRLPALDRALRLAVECSGQLALLHAAQSHGWEIALAPDRPTIKLPRSGRGTAPNVQVIWGDIDRSTGHVTSRRHTVIDCARRLPLRDSLPVLDSALRHGYDPDTLLLDAHGVRGKGAEAARTAAALASAAKANPFESRLHALAHEAGLEVRPQVEIDLPCDLRGPAPARVRPDLVDLRRRIVIEADSWEFHSGRSAFRADCLRYTVLTVAGWTVLRFTWWQVMHDADWVLDSLRHVGSVGPPRFLR